MFVMLKLTRTYINQILYLIILLFINPDLVLATVQPPSIFTPARTCNPVPSSIGDNFLTTNTAYGHVINNLDMSYNSSNCDSTVANASSSNPAFSFCIKNNDGNPIPCTNVTMNLGDSKTIKDFGGDIAISSQSIIKNITLTVQNIGGLICLTMPTSRGDSALICKLAIASILHPINSTTIPQCTNLGSSCYHNSYSQNIFSISGQAISCVKESLDKIFYRQNACDNSVTSTNSLRFFADFQQLLRQAIAGALIIYVIFYGINVVLVGGAIDLKNIMGFIMKMILVLYFSIGLGNPFMQDGKEMQHNGIIEYGLPFFSNAISEFAQLAFNASASKGLCDFDRTKYKQNYGFLALWDAVDCRLLYYLGVKLAYNVGDILNSLDESPQGGNVGSKITAPDRSNDALEILDSTGAALFFVVAIVLLLSGYIIIFICSLGFLILFLGMSFQLISLYIICMITLYAMAYIAPIFVPMALFERTKPYFDAWLKIIISCALQPMIAVGFFALLISMYDTAIYNNCAFQRHDYTSGDVNFSTFEMRLPTIDQQDCMDSPGYKLLRYYLGEGWSTYDLLIIQWPLLSADLVLLVNMVYVLLFSIIFYYFSEYITSFAAEITGGPLMSAVTLSPQKIIDGIKKGIKLAAGDKKELAKEVKDDKNDSKSDSASRDSASSGGGGDSQDSVSSGGGGGK